MDTKRTPIKVFQNFLILLGVLVIDLFAPTTLRYIKPEHSSILNTVLMILMWVLYLVGILIAYHYYKRNGYGRIKKMSSNDFWSGIKYFILAFVIEIVLNAANILINHQATSANNEEIINVLSRSNFTLIGMGVAILFLSPVIEELIFRGLLIDTIFPKNFFWIPIVVSGVLFSFAHLTTTIISFITYAMLGMFMAYAYRKTENLKVSILFHFVNNLVSGIPIILMVINNH